MTQKHGTFLLKFGQKSTMLKVGAKGRNASLTTREQNEEV